MRIVDGIHYDVFVWFVVEFDRWSVCSDTVGWTGITRVEKRLESSECSASFVVVARVTSDGCRLNVFRSDHVAKQQISGGLSMLFRLPNKTKQDMKMLNPRIVLCWGFGY
jgi:hypothetical protein